MKICTYCETEGSDDCIQCKSCGSNELSNKCNNCEMVFDVAFCPGCGVRAGEKPKACPSCGAKAFGSYCSKCGADLLNKKRKDHQPRKRAIRITNTSTDPDYIPMIVTKGCLTAFIAFFLLLLAFTIFVILLPPPPPPQPASLETLTIEGHPKFMDSYKETEAFWRGYNNIEVSRSMSDNYNKDFLLFVNGNDIIHYMSFDFSKTGFTIPQKEALKIVCDYIPYDKIDKYYDFSEAYTANSKHNRNLSSYHYIMKLNDEGKKANIGLLPELAFRVYTTDNINWHAEISYRSDKFEYEYLEYPDTNVKEWDVDINKYRPE